MGQSKAQRTAGWLAQPVMDRHCCCCETAVLLLLLAAGLSGHSQLGLAEEDRMFGDEMMDPTCYSRTEQDYDPDCSDSLVDGKGVAEDGTEMEGAPGGKNGGGLGNSSARMRREERKGVAIRDEDDATGDTGHTFGCGGGFWCALRRARVGALNHSSTLLRDSAIAISSGVCEVWCGGVARPMRGFANTEVWNFQSGLAAWLPGCLAGRWRAPPVQ
ncbi:hypothetical protein Mapa_016379 [Marchantia paleacea]|nr:hypothetical protein Mapa_016379 [Marchantia paleacea]